MKLRSHLFACIPAALVALPLSQAAAQGVNPAPGIINSPPNSFFGAVAVSVANRLQLLGPSGSTAVLNYLTFANHFTQRNEATAAIYVYFNQSSAADCGNSEGYSVIGLFEAQPGQTFQTTFPSGITLKPAAPGHYWCLMGSVSIAGNPGYYAAPIFGYAGYVLNGPPPLSFLAADPLNLSLATRTH
ncbi:hypothetical protein [Methylocystis heyeri]|uniref:Uncharacterized protein n=1 Tax=Methylocystis heyeri TaxID=391905 RepID=A0A6B8KD80_9HYPH|nr:hypothetical protein [Methylocystis heyeri]QGM44971.1 hypothetical protein H2LOC_004300 [Methylocystis heyeri]